jgi:glycosyltransferase involved in cell wall biosynthesis
VKKNMEPKKKIMILVDWFAPGYKAGGPIRSSLNVAFALKSNYDIRVLTTDTDHGETEPYKEISADTWDKNLDKDINVFYARKKTLSRKQLKNEITAAKADFIYLNHIWSPYFVLYPLWLKLTGQVKAKIVLCPRGGLYDSALSVKRYKKTPLLRLMKALNIQRHITFHATNGREKEAIERFFPGSKIVIADNLPSSVQPALVSCEKVPGKLKCVFIARIVAIKNLLFLLSALEKITSEVELTVVGPAEDEAYWNECKAKIEQLPSNVRVEYKGSLHNDKLMEVLQEHHLFILPTTGENFGHSIFEALIAGRPVLISDQTPWVNLESKKIGWDIPLQEPAKFTSVIEEAAAWNQQTFDEHAVASWQYANDFINNSKVKQDYFELFS